MSGVLQSFSDQYASALQGYFAHQDEAALEQAYVLGRKALAEKIGLVEMVSVHQKALADNLTLPLTPAKKHSLIKAADEFFRECIGPFEMTLRGFQESTAKLQQMNEILEKRVIERTDSMRRTAESLRALFQASPLAVIELDLDGHVLMWNPAAERLFGWKKEEVLGLPSPIIPADQEKETLILRGRALQGESFAMLETIRQKKNGSVIPVSYSLAPLYNNEKKALGVVMVFADITERKRTETKIQRQNALQQAIKKIFQETLISRTDEELGQVCLDVVEDITQSKLSFIGEIGADGLIHDIAISNPGWKLCSMYDQTGHRRSPGDFRIHGLYGRVLLDGKPFYTNDPASHPESIGTPEGHPLLKAFLGVPLIRGGRTIGMIAVGNRLLR